jgi:membrane protein
LFVFRRFNRDGGSSMAASLSYTSLLSLVPLLVIALAMLAAFPVFDSVRSEIEGWVFANFVPAVGDAVQAQVAAFVANAGRLSAAGIVGLGVTSIMLLVTIEGALNVVFRVARARSMISRLLVYWTVLTLGPLLIGGAFSVQTYLVAVSHWAGADGLGLNQRLAALLPTLLSIAAFTVLIAAVPNRRVRLADAVAGGTAAGLLFAALRWGFAIYVTSSQAYTTIYGAMAIIPIFLFWMFLSWAVVLIGAETAAALPEFRAGLVSGGGVSEERRLALSIEILGLLQATSLARGQGMSRRDLLDRLAVGERPVLAVLQRLIRAGFVAPTTHRHYLLARDLGAVTLWDVVSALGLVPRLDDGLGARSPWRQPVAVRIAEAGEAVRLSLDVPLRSLMVAENATGVTAG